MKLNPKLSKQIVIISGACITLGVLAVVLFVNLGSQLNPHGEEEPQFSLYYHVELRNITVSIDPAVRAIQQFAMYTADRACETAILETSGSERIYRSYFPNVETSIIHILQHMVAANYSTPTDIIDPLRIHILDYTVANIYITLSIDNPVQNIVKILPVEEKLLQGDFLAFLEFHGTQLADISFFYEVKPL
jgi:hypothetical protein